MKHYDFRIVARDRGKIVYTEQGHELTPSFTRYFIQYRRRLFNKIPLWWTYASRKMYHRDGIDNEYITYNSKEEACMNLESIKRQLNTEEVYTFRIIGKCDDVSDL